MSNKSNNGDAKMVSDIVGTGKCTCGCKDNANHDAANYAGKLDAALSSIASFVNPYPRNDNTVDSNIPYSGSNNRIATEYAYGNHPVGQQMYTVNQPGYTMFQQAMYKTADGADSRIAEAVEKFISDYDEFTSTINKLNRADDTDNSETIKMLNKSAKMARSCLMNSVMRFVTQPCTDDEVMGLITDFCHNHRNNASYIYYNDGKASKEDTVRAIKKYDDAITQLLIYKLSGLTR